MKLRLIDRRSDLAWLPGDELWERLEAICAEVGRGEWILDLVLVDDEIMVSLNESFREAKGVTDVLSFAYLAQAGAGGPDLPAGEAGARCDLWRAAQAGEEDAAVGEIILAPGFIDARCREKGWSFPDEIALLVSHGALHILGWEHSDTDLVKAMRDRESELLARVGLSHPLREGGS